jgi:hypothetical protein
MDTTTAPKGLSTWDTPERAAAEGPDASEAVVLSLQCHRPGGTAGRRLVLSADVSREDGTVLAQSPAYEIHLTSEQLAAHVATQEPEPVSQSLIASTVNSNLSQVEQWLKERASLIERDLSATWHAA